MFICACVWLFVSLARHTPTRNSPLSPRLVVALSGCIVYFTALADTLTKKTPRRILYLFFLGGNEAPRAADLTGDNKRRAPGDTKHGRIL